MGIFTRAADRLERIIMEKTPDNLNASPLKKMNLLQIVLSFLKIGVIGFGGGSVLIPVIEREIVESRQAMDDSTYLKHTVVTNITPGTLPVKLGATIGYQLKGLPGSLLASHSVMLPGVILTILLMSLFAGLGSSALHYVNYASLGITAFIIFLLLHFVQKTIRSRINLALCLGAFVLTGGREVRLLLAHLLAVDADRFGVPLLDISTIDLMIITFFAIILSERLRAKREFAAVLALGILYALAGGKGARAIGWDRYKPIVLAVMVLVLVLAIILRRRKRKSKTRLYPDRSFVLTLAVYLLLPVVLGLAAHFSNLVNLAGDALDFLGKVLLSTVTSFGGGEAYVAVAEGIFVQGGYIEADLFFTRLVPIANALPGPILVKIAVGIGYMFGSAATGNLGGWVLGLLAAVVSLSICCVIAMLVLRLYDSIGQSTFVQNLKRYILPVICGMLLSTCITLFNESMKIAGEKRIPGGVTCLAVAALVAGIWFLYQKFRLHDVLLLVLSAGLTLGIMLLI
jgi:chromate transporter